MVRRLFVGFAAFVSELSVFALLSDVATGDVVWNFVYPTAMTFPTTPYPKQSFS